MPQMPARICAPIHSLKGLRYVPLSGGKMPFLILRMASSSADQPQGNQSHPGKSNVLGGHIVALPAKGIQKCQLKGNIIIVGVRLSQVLSHITESLVQVLRGIALHHGSHGSADHLGKPCAAKLFPESPAVRIHFRPPGKVNCCLVLRKRIIHLVLPVWESVSLTACPSSLRSFAEHW